MKVLEQRLKDVSVMVVHGKNDYGEEGYWTAILRAPTRGWITETETKDRDEAVFAAGRVIRNHLQRRHV